MWILSTTCIIFTIVTYTCHYFGHLKLMKIYAFLYFTITITDDNSFFVIILRWCNWYRNNLSLKLNHALVNSVQLLSCVQLFAIPWTAARQASLSIAKSWSLLKVMSIKSVMPSTISSSVVPFSSHLQSFLASGSFPMSQFFESDGQSIGVSASASSFQWTFRNDFL